MIEKLKIAIITPTYNDAKLLKRLYKSLENQHNDTFTWIIVDDGSIDNTKELISQIKSTASFEVRPIFKRNGGKCRAVNLAYDKNPDFDFYMVIDSDEEIVEGAINQLFKKVTQYLQDETVGSIYFWRDMNNDLEMKKRFMNRPNGDCIQNIYGRKRNDKIYGDGAIGYYNRFLKKYHFKEFEGENFIGEITILLEAALIGYADQVVYVDSIISKGSYSKLGLSAQGRKLRIKNPYGMIYYSAMMQSNKMRNWRINAKYMISAQAYAWISHIKKTDLKVRGISASCLKWWAVIPGIIVGEYWKRI